MKEKTRPKERKNREKRGSKKDQKISSLEESQQNESKKRLTSSPYIYTHTLLRTESVHKNREGTLSLSLFCTALFLYISYEISILSLSPRRRRRRRRRKRRGRRCE
jgi:hypothetical protein